MFGVSLHIAGFGTISRGNPKTSGLPLLCGRTGSTYSDTLLDIAFRIPSGSGYNSLVQIGK